MTDLIDAYLDDLLPRLRGPAHDVRSTLAEAEAHLRDAADADVAAGMDPQDAQRRAISSFGSAREVATAANRGVLGVSAAELGQALAGAATRMVAVGLVAIAVATLGARALAGLTSTHFVFGTPSGASLAASQCRHWLAIHPSASTCARAATLENADDTVVFHLGGAILGLAILAVAYFVARRFWRPTAATRAAIPAGVVPAIGATVFGTVGIALVVAGLSDAMVSGLWGRGLWYVEGAVALVIAVGYAVGFGRALLTAAA